MKKVRFLFVILPYASVALSSCGSNKTGPDNKLEVTTATPETGVSDSVSSAAVGASKTVAAVYECPMGCKGSRSDKPGKCPTCGMELVKK